MFIVEASITKRFVSFSYVSHKATRSTPAAMASLQFPSSRACAAVEVIPHVVISTLLPVGATALETRCARHPVRLRVLYGGDHGLADVLVITGANTGLAPGYPWRVLDAYRIAMPTAFCCVLVVRPLVIRLVAWTVHAAH